MAAGTAVRRGTSMAAESSSQAVARTSSSGKDAGKQSKKYKTSASKRPPLGKQLASSDKETRETAVEHLLAFLAGTEEGTDDGRDGQVDKEDLSTQVGAEHDMLDWDNAKLPKQFREEEMLVMWQGCFYCMYMCDKPLPQQKLANQLAEPLLSILSNPKLNSKGRTRATKASLMYLATFWWTMLREWPSIDKYRTDKYYSLMRAMVRETFKLGKATQWNERVMQEVTRIYTRESGGALHLQSTKTPISIAYHVIDIYLDELEKSLDSDSPTSTGQPAPLVQLVQPMMEVLATTPSKQHFQRVTERILDPVLQGLDKASAGGQESEQGGKRRKLNTNGASNNDNDDEYQRILADQPESVRDELLGAIFKRAAKEDTADVNRKRMYSYTASKGYDGE